VNIIPCHGLSPAEIDEIETSLYAFNSAATGRDDALAMGFVIRGEAGKLLAVIAGHSWAGIAEIEQLWVDSKHRSRGWARALLDAFVAEARSRCVRRIWVATFDFQAPRFYEKAGFVRSAELSEWPEGHTHIILSKALS
jgi:ribosomal protein S18 acetylase RimI-like enzyme